MDLQTRKLHFIEEILGINNERVMTELEAVLNKERQVLNPILKDKLTSRALEANEDIKAGRLYNREEAETKLQERMEK